MHMLIFFLLLCGGAGDWVQRFAQCLAPSTCCETQFREPTAPLLQVDSYHLLHACEVGLNGCILHNFSVRAWCLFASSVQMLSITLCFHRELLIPPSLASKQRTLNKCFGHIIEFSYRNPMGSSVGCQDTAQLVCLDHLVVIISSMNEAPASVRCSALWPVYTDLWFGLCQAVVFVKLYDYYMTKMSWMVLPPQCGALLWDGNIVSAAPGNQKLYKNRHDKQTPRVLLLLVVKKQGCQKGPFWDDSISRAISYCQQRKKGTGHHVMLLPLINF